MDSALPGGNPNRLSESFRGKKLEDIGVGIVAEVLRYHPKILETNSQAVR